MKKNELEWGRENFGAQKKIKVKFMGKKSKCVIEQIDNQSISILQGISQGLEDIMTSYQEQMDRYDIKYQLGMRTILSLGIGRCHDLINAIESGKEHERDSAYQNYMAFMKKLEKKFKELGLIRRMEAGSIWATIRYAIQIIGGG